VKGFRLGRIFGVEIVIDPSWIVIAALITFSLYVEFRSINAETSAATIGAVAAGSALLFFGSVLVHELSHSIVAIRRGTKVRRIRLFIFGGVSEIETEATTPQDEFAITAAGPGSSFALAAVFFGLDWAVGTGLFSQVVGLLAVVNLALGIFNLLPGFPLDGGRLLRSLVWRITGDFAKGTRIAVAGGKLVAATLAAVGLYVLAFLGSPAGLWWVAIAWFLYQAAAASGVDLQQRAMLRDITAGEMMSPTPVSVDADIDLDQLFDDYLVGGRSATFPVVDAGRVRGLVALAQVTAVPRPEWGKRTVRSVMVTLGPDDVVDADAPVKDFLPRFARSGRRLAVVRDGRMVGVVSRVDIERWMHRARA
jgi:Zn-dependent protease/CBS domain-containing protein